MTERQKVITASTLIPLSVLGAVAAVIWAASGVYSEVKASTKANERQDTALTEHARIIERTATILERLERKR